MTDQFAEPDRPAQNDTFRPENDINPEPSMEQLWDDIREMFHEARRDTGEARWFVTKCCQPIRKPFELPQRAAVVGGSMAAGRTGYRWEFPYRTRMIDSARRYLALSERDANMLKAGVEDGVHWRGEPVEFYIGIVNETLKMREVGLDAYLEANEAKLDILA